MLKVFLLATAIAALAFEAHADWQYTKWGMNPTEVVAASQGTAIALTKSEADKQSISDQGLRAQLNFPYNAGELTFQGYFYFKDEKLAAIGLYLTDLDKSSLLLSILADLYDPPIEKSDVFGSRRVWKDRNSGNIVRYTQLQGLLTSIIYTQENGATTPTQ